MWIRMQTYIMLVELLWAGSMYTELNSSCIFGPFVIKYRLSVQTIYREGLFWALVIHRPSLVTLANICKYTTSTVHSTQTRTLRRMKCHIFSLS